MVAPGGVRGHPWRMDPHRPPSFERCPQPGWDPLRQAACEVIHRAVTERRDDPTHTDLHAFTPQLKQRIRRFISSIDERPLLALVARDLEENGYFRQGWPHRWPACEARARSVPPDPSRETDSARMPQR